MSKLQTLASLLNLIVGKSFTILEILKSFSGGPPLEDDLAERLRRWTANPMCSARVGSNPTVVEFSKILKFSFQ